MSFNHYISSEEGKGGHTGCVKMIKQGMGLQHGSSLEERSCAYIHATKPGNLVI